MDAPLLDPVGCHDGGTGPVQHPVSLYTWLSVGGNTARSPEAWHLRTEVTSVVGGGSTTIPGHSGPNKTDLWLPPVVASIGLIFHLEFVELSEAFMERDLAGPLEHQFMIDHDSMWQWLEYSVLKHIQNTIPTVA